MKSINLIKKAAIVSLLFLFFSTSNVFAQNDTMYIMKSGIVVGKYNINLDVDSIIFYKPKAQTDSIVVDVDGNIYHTVEIGNQIWLKENLATTKFNDNTPINLVNDSTYYCWYNFDSITYKNTYGALYNWYTINTGKLCPIGWHVPSDNEWIILENYLISNGYNYDGTTTGSKIAKSLGATINWDYSNNIGVIGNNDFPEKRNLSKFTAMPGGLKHNTSSFFSDINRYGLWWSSSSININYAWRRGLNYSTPELSVSTEIKSDCLSVRCIKD